MIKSIDDLDLAGKRVFIRVDFNVPIEGGDKVGDDSRIVASLPTIQHACNAGAKVILASHLGRPEGQVNPKYSLLPVAAHLSEIMEKEILFPEDCIGNVARKLVAEMREGDILLLENLRFHPGEEANDPIFSEKLAAYADVYINDAFGTLHRAHASTVGMVPLVSERAAGKLVNREVSVLGNILQEPAKPLVVVLGGSKVSDKLGVLENLMKRADAFLIGGAMAYTFLKAKGVEIGSSLVEEAKVHQATKILERAKNKDIPFLLPVDHVIAKTLAPGAAFQATSGEAIGQGWKGVDIGPATLELFRRQLKGAKTILWNGPVGAFEIPPFDQGTVALARMIAESPAVSVVGGGDSLSAIKQAGLSDRITHLSTGGGATLEFLEGKVLPGLKALEVEA